MQHLTMFFHKTWTKKEKKRIVERRGDTSDERMKHMYKKRKERREKEKSELQKSVVWTTSERTKSRLSSGIVFVEFWNRKKEKRREGWGYNSLSPSLCLFVGLFVFTTLYLFYFYFWYLLFILVYIILNFFLQMGINWVAVIFSFLPLFIIFSNGQTTLPLGCIYPLSQQEGDSNSLQQIIELAVSEINNNQIIPNYHLSVQVRYFIKYNIFFWFCNIFFLYFVYFFIPDISGANRRCRETTKFLDIFICCIIFIIIIFLKFILLQFTAYALCIFFLILRNLENIILIILILFK